MISEFDKAGIVKQPVAKLGRTMRRISPGLMLSALFCPSSAALAAGLAQPLAVPIIGQPLDIAIPLVLAPGEIAPPTGCIRLMKSAQASDPQFFPRNARVVVESGNRPQVRIVSAEAVAEPMLEFRLALGCDTAVARDFLLLADNPGSAKREVAETRTAAEARSDISVEIVPAARQLPVGLAPHYSTDRQGLKLAAATNLNAMARRLFPDSRERRDDYRRLIAKANPSLFGGVIHVGSVPLPAGTFLHFPAALTMPRSDRPTQAAGGSNSELGLINVAAVFDAPAIAAATGRKTKRDHLVVGSARAADIRRPPALMPREISAAIERIERMVEDQGRTEVQLVGGLDTVNAAFVEMKEFVQMLDTEQRQLQRAYKMLERRVDSLPEPKSLGMTELLGLILAAGSVGAVLIMLSHRMQMRRLAEIPVPEPMTNPAPLARAPIVAKPSLSFV